MVKTKKTWNVFELYEKSTTKTDFKKPFILSSYKINDFLIN